MNKIHTDELSEWSLRIFNGLSFMRLILQASKKT